MGGRAACQVVEEAPAAWVAGTARAVVVRPAQAVASEAVAASGAAVVASEAAAATAAAQAAGRAAAMVLRACPPSCRLPCGRVAGSYADTACFAVGRAIPLRSPPMSDSPAPHTSDRSQDAKPA